MSEVKICTYKQVDRVLSKLQKDITDLRKDKNIYNDKQFGRVKFPVVKSKCKNSFGNKTALTEFEKGRYFGILAGLKYARQIIGNYRDNFSSYVNKFDDREMKKIMPNDCVLAVNYPNEIAYKDAYKESMENKIIDTNSKINENISTTKVKLKKINNKRKTIRKHKSCKCKRGK